MGEKKNGRDEGWFGGKEGELREHLTRREGEMVELARGKS